MPARSPASSSPMWPRGTRKRRRRPKKKGRRRREDASCRPPPMIVLVPITDYKAPLATSRHRQPVPPAAVTVEINGKPAFLKSIGDGYAALARRRRSQFTGKAGNAKAHEAALGIWRHRRRVGRDDHRQLPCHQAQPGRAFERSIASREPPMGMMVGGEEIEGIGVRHQQLHGPGPDGAGWGSRRCRRRRPRHGPQFPTRDGDGQDLSPGRQRRGPGQAPKQDYLPPAADLSIRHPRPDRLAIPAEPPPTRVADAEAVTPPCWASSSKADGRGPPWAPRPAMMGSGFLPTPLPHQDLPPARSSRPASRRPRPSTARSSTAPLSPRRTTASTKVNGPRWTPGRSSCSRRKTRYGVAGGDGALRPQRRALRYVAQGASTKISDASGRTPLMSAALDAARAITMSTDTLSTCRWGARVGADGRGLPGGEMLLDMVSLPGMLGSGRAGVP